VVRIVGSGYTSAIPLLSNGRPFNGYSVQVVDENSRALPEAMQGRVLVAGPSVISSYFGTDDPATTGGWLDTGDLGFLLNGELYISGRAKDVIISNGENFAAHEIEQVALSAAGENAVRAVAFSVPHLESLRDEIIVEVDVRKQAMDEVGPRIRRALLRELGLQIADVLVVPRGAIPRTTSGKTQRQRAREMYIANALQPPSSSVAAALDRHLQSV
jgi:acyl-CoA synthetase (AMP-forming)/AMP-acid ligase II